MGRRAAATATLANLRTEPVWQVVRIVDVAGRAEVVARDEERRERARALVRDRAPRGAGEQDGMAALARDAWSSVPDEGARALAPLLVPCDDLGPPGDVDYPDDLPERFTS